VLGRSRVYTKGKFLGQEGIVQLTKRGGVRDCITEEKKKKKKKKKNNGRQCIRVCRSFSQKKGGGQDRTRVLRMWGLWPKIYRSCVFCGGCKEKGERKRRGWGSKNRCIMGWKARAGSEGFAREL